MGALCVCSSLFVFWQLRGDGRGYRIRNMGLLPMRFCVAPFVGTDVVNSWAGGRFWAIEPKFHVIRFPDKVTRGLVEMLFIRLVHQTCSSDLCKWMEASGILANFGKKRNTDHDFIPLFVKYGVGK